MTCPEHPDRLYPGSVEGRGTVLLTGAAGFLGTQIARHLLEDTDRTLIGLVRAGSRETAVRRLQRAWWDWPTLAGTIGERVEVLRGDVCASRMGLDESAYNDLLRRVTHIIHTAADLRLNAPIAELRRTNVQGTANVLELARAVQRDHGLVRLSHVSTAYVAGRRTGSVPEDALTGEYGFSSSYEFSKYEGERLVQEAKAELPVSVFRPGMIVGDSRTGAIKTFNTFYVPLRLYLTGRLRVLPARPGLLLNIVPVDYVARAIARLTFDPEAEGLNFHLTAPCESLPTAGELVAFVREWAGEQLDVRLPRPIFISMPVSRRRYRLLRAAPRAKGVRSSLLTLLPYLDERLQFRRDNVDLLLGPYQLDWRQFLPRLLEHAAYAGFMHRSERTVHEQVIFRLRGKSRRITYHDIVENKVITRSSEEVLQDMLAAAGALRAMGIGSGDRVAIVGLNSTRFLTLDVAIGLTGAVSVPLYYTSPPAEVDMILQASGARVFLVGAPKLLERLGELTTELPVVSFCRGPLPENLRQKVVPWGEFLASRGNPPDEKGSESSGFALGLGDLATLRYTSGTTGRPKGVVFHHEHLRWMGESIASLLPWKARNAHILWLSCLPMNHVVEGILATYSPYYLPTTLDLYFLEDLPDLKRALPLVRPTMFFSVPRIYERVWEGLQKNRLGRLYLRLQEGPAKGVLRPLLRRSLLRKAGLDRCVQLIVGSAPVGEKLLRGFHDLGIEVHNAYGLTEAPLVTINRLGANRLGTVGKPLPATRVRIAADGEVLVSGPQVTGGYFDESESPIRDGWLLTGDLGRLTDDGYLVLEGRKKELIKTSYGKYVQPAKVEAMLREVPGVSEAMLVGEGRPYCVALLWSGDDRRDSGWAEAADRAILQINTRLSRPEQVKRWAILTNDLSPESGDLTTNLKLKRTPVARRLQRVLNALYAESYPGSGALAENILHLGQAGRDETQ